MLHRLRGQRQQILDGWLRLPTTDEVQHVHRFQQILERSQRFVVPPHLYQRTLLKLFVSNDTATEHYRQKLFAAVQQPFEFERLAEALLADVRRRLPSVEDVQVVRHARCFVVLGGFGYACSQAAGSHRVGETLQQPVEGFGDGLRCGRVGGANQQHQVAVTFEHGRRRPNAAKLQRHNINRLALAILLEELPDLTVSTVRTLT